MRLISAALLEAVLAFGMPSMVHYAWFIRTAKIKTSSVLHIPYRLLYACFIYFCVSIMIQRLVGMVRDIKQLKRLKAAKTEKTEEGGNAV